MDIIWGIFAIVCFFVIAVFLISIIKNCSIKKSTLLLKEFLIEIFTTLFQSSENSVMYPSVVGFQDGRIVGVHVEEAFKPMYSSFASCYLQGYHFSKNNDCIIYRFSIKRKKDDISDSDLECLLQKQAEEVLAHQLIMYDCYVSAEALTCVVLKEHEMVVAFARTTEGVEMLDKEKEKLRYRKKMEHERTIQQENTFTEEWSDKK